MDEIWLENQAKQEGQDGEVDQAMIDSLAADLAAAINGTYMKKIKVESELIESDLELEVQSSLSDQDLTINENVNITEDSFNSETLSPLSSEKILKLEHLNNSFSVLPKQSPSNEDFSCWQPTKIAMDKELLRLLGDPSSCSFKVYIGKYKFRCHLHVLQSHSYFLRYKRVDTLSVHLPIKMVTPTAFKVLYNWMLGIKGERKKKERPKGCNIVELYSAVSFLKVNELQEFSYICFNDGCNFGSLAFRLFLEAQKFEIPMIQTLTLSRIQEFFLPLVASKEFLELDFYWLQKLLNMNNVGVNSEIEIFMTAVRWLSHNWSVRKDLMAKLMNCVRFCLIPPLFLRFLQGEQKTRVLNSICQCPKIKETVTRVFVYTSTELGDLTQRFCGLVNNIDPPEQRKWIFDKRCSYHRHPGGNQGQFFTYQQFLNHLESLHDSLPDHGSWVNGVLAKSHSKPKKQNPKTQ